MRFKQFFLLIAVISLISCQPTQKTSTTILTYVNPFIGTGFHGHTFPGAVLPHGMVQLSPDTRLPGWDASSGYHYSDSTIYGFSHTHLSGTGIGDMGDILFLPFTGVAKDTLIATFDKKKEQASVGYYQVHLDNFDVKAELTATLRTGMHRYTFPKNEEQQLLIDLGHILQANWGHKSIFNELVIENDKSISGTRISSGWANDNRVHFYAEFSKPFQLKKATNQGHSTDTLRGTELKAWLTFPSNENQELLVKVGISYVDVEGAKQNLAAENKDWSFENIQESAEEAWSEALSKIEISTSDEAVKTNFYTAMYHSLLAPMLMQDVDGRYFGMDKQIHQAKGDFVNYSVFSMWDTFRALHPLMTIIDKKKSNEWMRSLLKKYEEGGVLPKWDLVSNYTGTMVGYPSVAIIADAMAKDIDDFDVKKALEAAMTSSSYRPDLIANIQEPRANNLLPKQLDFIEKVGFIPADSINNSVSYGLECAYYDWCIAQIALQTNDQVTAEKYLNRSKQYQQYFDAKIGFMRGKLANGEWKIPFDPYFSDHENSVFVEGNSWQWMWFVPHDVDGYVELMGGKSAFEAKLDELFSAKSEITGENASADITGLIGQYAHGNEPSHHVAHLYNYIDQPRKAQEKLDKILQTFYLPTPEGIIGNEDCGAMSAWYVMNALGFYQVCPGDATYTISRPMVDEAIIHLENGKQIKVKVHNNSPSNKYVEKVSVNGKGLESWFFSHKDIENGGVIEFWMTS